MRGPGEMASLKGPRQFGQIGNAISASNDARRSLRVLTRHSEGQNRLLQLAFISDRSRPAPRCWQTNHCLRKFKLSSTAN